MVSGSGAGVTSDSSKYSVVTSVKVVPSIEGKSRGMQQWSAISHVIEETF